MKKRHEEKEKGGTPSTVFMPQSTPSVGLDRGHDMGVHLRREAPGCDPQNACMGPAQAELCVPVSAPARQNIYNLNPLGKGTARITDTEGSKGGGSKALGDASFPGTSAPEWPCQRALGVWVLRPDEALGFQAGLVSPELPCG